MTLVFRKYPHDCTVPPDTLPPKSKHSGFGYRLKKLYFSLNLASIKNHLTIEQFSSEWQVKHERKRHYYSKYYFTVHPLSIMAVIIDVYLCFFYFGAVIFRLIDVAFMKKSEMGTAKYAGIVCILNILDVFSWFNLILYCFSGVILPNNEGIIIGLPRIFRYRLKSVVFWGELMSSVPKGMICPIKDSCSFTIWTVLTFLRICVITLCFKPTRLLKHSLRYIHVTSRPLLIIIQLSYFMAFVTHVMACAGYAFTRYRITLSNNYNDKSWIYYKGLQNATIFTQYSYAFFRASAQTFGIPITEFQDNTSLAECLISVLSYIVGRLMLHTMWVVVLQVLLGNNLQETRFQEIITQLRNWMVNKDMPRALQQRIIDYYDFYYRKRFFSKRQVQKVIPESLNTKVKSNMYKILKESNISLFEKLSQEEIQAVGEYFVMEIYSPNDVIIYSGTKGDSLYLLASGSVAVYTHSGKEVCHLHDGAYFGELALLMTDNRVTATIIALETTKVYRIPKIYFEKYILCKKELREMFMFKAEERLQTIAKIEEEYRRTLFQQMYMGQGQ